LHNSKGQCAFEGELLIEDQSTTSIPIFVSGAINDDLATNNCLSAVTLHFEHDFIGDIIIELVSPAGQVVTLVGPSATISANTSFINWNVQFFAQELIAIPDAGYDPVWNSLQTWFSFTTYVGKYYPFMGQLEDFNTGTVNGAWTLNIIDQVQFGEGNVFCVDLIFCNEDGINVGTCSLPNHNVLGTAIQTCEGDSILDLTLDTDISGTYDENIYTYGYLLFEDGLFQSVVSGQNFMDAEPGDYEICGIYYFLEELSLLNNLPVNVAKEALETYIEDNGICANISGDCLSITILERPDVITQEVSICQGDTLTVNGAEYAEAGLYEVIVSQEPCDSIAFLDLTVIDIELELEAQSDSLSCDFPTVILDASTTELPANVDFHWSTNDGNIISKPDSVQLEIDQPGTYTFEVVQDGCPFIDDIVIGEKEDFVEIDLNANVLTCLVDSTFIDLTVSDGIDSVSWSGANGFSRLNEDIRVGSGGIYSVFVRTAFGCEVIRDIEVIEERVFPDINISGDNLSCTQDSVILFTFPADTLGSSFQWFDEDEVLSMDTFLTVKEPGIYSLEVTTALSCIDTFEYEVLSEFVEISAELISDTIDCNASSVTIGYTSGLSDLNILWKLPDGTFLIDSTFTSSQEGEYLLSLDNGQGCVLDTMFTVVRDEELPDVSIEDATFFCGEDSIRLVAQSSHNDLLYTWTRPDGIVLNERSPYIFSPGEYTLEACRPNGCCARDTVLVGVDNTVPSLDFETENISCASDTVYITPSDTSSFLMEWSLNGMPLSVSSNVIEVTTPGFYEVLVTDEDNGCKSRYSFDIVTDFTDEIDTLTAVPLNCVNIEVQIEVQSSRQVDEYFWSGPGLLDGDLEPMVNLPGNYIIDYTLENGCSGSDTILVIQEGEFPNLQAENQTISCTQDEVTLTVEYESSDISVTWTGPDFEQPGVSVQTSVPGMYTAIGIASGSCTDTIEVEVFADTLAPIISIANDGEITCADSSVLITATIDNNTALYEIVGPQVADPEDLMFSVETAGDYSILAIGDNGCLSEATVEVVQSTEFPDYDINLDSLSCIVDEVMVGFSSSDADLEVEWNAPIPITQNLYMFSTDQTGNYVFTLTNANGCTITDSFFVFSDTLPPSGAIDLSSQINCLIETVTLSVTEVSQDLMVNWSGPGVTDPTAMEFMTDEVGIYTLTLTSVNGCTKEDEIRVLYDTLSPEIQILGDPINCSAGKTFLRVNSDLEIESYNWTGPDGFASTDAEPLIFAQGIYNVEVVAVNGCVSTDMISVEDERVFPEIEVNDFYLPCDDAPEEIFTRLISDGSIVRWFGPNNYFASTDTALVLEAGEYIAIAINEDGCTANDTFQVIDEPVLPEFSGTAELLLCLGPVSMTALEVEDDRSLLWVGPDGFMSEDNPALTDDPGLYQLIVTGDNGCVDTITVEVVDGRIYPDAVANLNEPFQCENLEVNLSGQGSATGARYSLAWSTSDGNILSGANTLSPRIDEEGTYILKVTDNTIGCISYDTLVVVVQEQGLTGVVAEVIEPTCQGFGNAEINLTEFIGGFGPYQVFVDDFSYGNRTNIPYLKSGEHLVSIIDSIGCQYDTLFTITEDNILTVDLPGDTTLCFGDTLFLSPEISFGMDSISSIMWSSNVPCNGCQEIDLVLNDDAEITIQVEDLNGCIVEDQFFVKINRPNNLPFPQIFSPNGDDINEVFYMPMTKGLENIDYIKIYDNWGGLLYEEENLSPGDDSQGWRGTVNGSNVEMGVYIVEALVTLEDGSQVVYVGDVTLIR